MKFLVDAQLPRRLALQLRALRHDALHTLDCPAGNKTPDEEIVALAIQENRVVITKDNDFVTSFLLRRVPPKLLLISIGNSSNDALCRLISASFPAVEKALASHDFVELSPAAITIHD